MAKFREEGRSKAERGWKLGLLYQTFGQDAKVKFYKEITSPLPVNTQMVRKQKSLTAYVEKVLVSG